MAVDYHAIRLIPNPARATIISGIMRSMLRFETMFTDYQKEDETKMLAIASSFTSTDSLTWEVWKHEDGKVVDVVGIFHLSDIRTGHDAVAHYVFFDGDLRGKTDLTQKMLDWAFTDHEDWPALQRLTIEVPDFAFALARHAQKKLGFGGPFKHRIGGKSINVEGVKQGALIWRGEPRDLLLMGKLNDNA